MSLGALASTLRAYRSDRLRQYWDRVAMGDAGGIGRKHRAFHRSNHKRRLIRGGNQTGKSWSGAAEVWAHAIGEHPYRDVRPDPMVGWVVVADLENQYPTYCSKLRELEPAFNLAEGVRYSPERGYFVGGRRAIKVKTAGGGESLIEFRSGAGAVIALASGTIDWLCFDEPPKRDHWSEALSRVAVRGGPVWCVMTPVGRPVGWLREHVEGDPAKGTPPAEEWEQTVLHLTTEDCPHRSQASIDEQTAGYLADERLQRTIGAWEGVTTNRMFDGWRDGLIFDYPAGASLSETLLALGAPDDVSIGLAGDHGEERAGANFWLLFAYSDAMRTAWVLDEWASEGAVTEDRVAEAILVDLLQGSGLSPIAVDRAVGDVNTPGMGPVRRLNQVIQARIAALLRSADAPFTIRDASKGPGSVREGVRAINVACKSGRLRVSSRCGQLIGALRHWKGPGVKETNHLKDAIDALRYGTVAPGFLFDAWRLGPAPRMTRG